MRRMVLMTYTPRELDEGAYHEFIRAIDYPNFQNIALWTRDWSRHGSEHPKHWG
jgi:hypothetical protein